MALLNYCRCGCAWNPGCYTACPKCEGGEELEAFDHFALPDDGRDYESYEYELESDHD